MKRKSPRKRQRYHRGQSRARLTCRRGRFSLDPGEWLVNKAEGSHEAATLLSSSRPRNNNGLASAITDSSGSTIFQSLSYTYAVDRVTSVYRGHETTQWDYRYDTRGQVTSADKRFYYLNPFAAGLETEYTYDMAGNRLTKQQ